MTGADLIARILKQEGVDFMGVIPFNTLEEAAAKAGIRPLIFRQERVVVDYINWGGGEPNGGTNENFLTINVGGLWNDLGDTQLNYIIEIPVYDGNIDAVNHTINVVVADETGGDVLREILDARRQILSAEVGR